MDDTTIFTKIINKEIPASIIYEDEKHLAFLDIRPFEKGHTLVIPKKPYENIFEMPENELQELISLVQKIAKHYNKTLNCGINIAQNNLKISGQEVNHLHFHIIPRLEDKKLYHLENCKKYEENELREYEKKLKLD
ncbi:MAG: HIT family protein [Nanoarchaeota archaeon]